MARYDYHCRSCHTYQEVERSIHADEEAVSCPTCDTQMHKVYGPIGVIMKGDGFYKNDSKRVVKNFYPENGDSL